MSYIYIKLPRFDGRKTLAFNGAVFIVASGWLTAAYSGLTGFGPVGENGLYALAAVAALNGLLRVMTSRPVWWRQFDIWRYEELDPVISFDEPDGDVYAKAAEFVKDSDFTEHRDRAAQQARSIPLCAVNVSNADFQADLDRQLVAASAMVDARAAETGEIGSEEFIRQVESVLPLDADQEKPVS